VIGAGAFGGWTALQLLRRGARVTLLDAWGPGNSRASSGGETRIIRNAYGPDPTYCKMAARALHLWREHELHWRRQFFHATGVLWLAAALDDPFQRASLGPLRDADIPFEELSIAEVEKRWPQINLEGVAWGMFEPNSGYLLARSACHAVVEGFLAEGGEYRELMILPGGLETAAWRALLLSDGSTLQADRYVFACGPWLGRLFPETVGPHLSVTRQEVFFFGTPAGSDLFSGKHMPVWGDHHQRFTYGIPGNQGRGFKIADDTRGPQFDPTSGDRTVSAEGMRLVREYAAYRFPALKNAPVLETRVCQYECTADDHFILDRHPLHPNVWLAGGGSGHGFKHGPAIGEMLARLVMEEGTPEATFQLARFSKKP